MRTLALSRYAFSISAAAALLAACIGPQQPMGAPGAMPQVASLAARTNSKNYKVLYSFGAVPDGNYPHSNLINMGGTFYGTTFAGGAYYCGSSRCGTVFSITKGGAENVLHSFGSGSDGFFPFAGLTSVHGTLYGTTGNGGAYHSGTGGTVFSITTGGTEKVLHSFGSGTDGSGPTADLIDVKGTLYGTTSAGGAYNAGTVFSITTRGKERVLYSFRAGTDGELPEAGLTDVSGTLYGTTIAGGGSGCANGYGCGTVFRITTNGMERVLYSFGGSYDGASPGGLTNVKGTLYGTTAAGGGSQNGGTVFSITTGGIENVLHRFGNGADGFQPLADMHCERGSLVGTTYLGGVYGVGTIFSLTL